MHYELGYPFFLVRVTTVLECTVRRGRVAIEGRETGNSHLRAALALLAVPHVFRM
jgi:hypothetical protein